MRFPKRALATLATVSLITLAACGGSGDDPGAAGPTSDVDSGEAAPPTPVSDEIIAAAKQEGAVVLYSNANEEVMRPLAAGFQEKYPEIEVRNLDLDDAQVVERYRTETATGTPTADLVMSSNQLTMQQFVDEGHVLDYEDPNVPNLPDYAALAPGVVAISQDPVIALFNKSVLPESEQPDSLEGFVDLIPELGDKIGTLDVNNPIGLAATAAYLDNAGEKGWENLEALGKVAGVESGTGNLAQKLLQGGYAATFFVAGSVRPLITGDAAKVLNYTYMTDGTPLVPRAMAITSAASHPNAAKLFMNYALSVEGQEEACKGGFSPYRSGVECPYGLAAIKDVVGEENVIVGGWDPELGAERESILARWNAAFGR